MRFLILLALLLPSVALGASATWETCEDMTGTENATIGPFTPRCADFITANLITEMLHVGMCDNFDAIYNADTTGSETTTTVQVMSCVMATVSSDNCLAVDNATLSGTDSSFEILGAAAEWIYVQATTNPVATTPRILIRCNK